MNDRTCIVTRLSGSNEDLIRFVADPQGTLIPDIRGNLPGRGAWVKVSRKTVEEAIKRKAFVRSLKADVQVDADLADLTDQLLVKDVMGSLSMTRKAGHVITGASKVDAAIRRGEAAMVLHEKQAAEDGMRKIAQAIHAAKQQGLDDVPVYTLLTGDELSLAFGENHVIHAAVLKGAASQSFITKARRLQRYRDE